MRLPVLELPPRRDRAARPLPDTGPRSIGAVRMLRLSLTDRCNFRCVYCMPAGGVEWLPSRDVLSDAEIVEVVRAAAEEHGIRRFKLTGGEPTLRPGLADLVRSIPDLYQVLLAWQVHAWGLAGAYAFQVALLRRPQADAAGATIGPG